MTDRLGGPDGAADAEPRIEVGLATDVGRVRSGNEDSILCEPLESVLVAENGRTSLRAVTVGADLSGGRVEVLSGLSSGERVMRSAVVTR